MSWIRSLGERLRALLRKRQVEAEMAEELQYHLERETEKNIQAGLSPREARRLAHARFGGVERVKEQVRDERGVRAFEDLALDVRYAFRSLLRSPGFTLVAILSMALGIGVNTAMFSVANAILVRELPVREPGTLVNFYRDRAYTAADPMSYPDYRVLREGTTDVFEDVGGFQFAFVTRDEGASVASLVAEMVTGNYFSMLGVQAHLGRMITPEDHVAPGAHPVVALGYRYWEQSFGRDPGVVGTSIRLGGRLYTIVGVAPSEFTGSLLGVIPDLYAPIMMVQQLLPLGGDALGSRGWNAFNAVGRLRAGVGMADATGAVSRVTQGLGTDFPEAWPAGDSLLVTARSGVVFNPAVDRILVPANFLAMGIVALVLLIACSNLASFLLARAGDRQAEAALKLALGAGRWRLGRQHVSETLLLALLGGGVGIVLARGVLDLGVGLARSSSLPIGLDLSLDGTVLGFTAAVTVLTGVMVGLIPALQATRPDLMATLKDGAGRASVGGPVRLGHTLVGAQVAVSLVLLIVAGLFVRSFSASQALDVGFGDQPTAMLSFVNPADRMTTEEGRAVAARMVREAERVSGVTDVGLVSNMHLNTVNTMFLDINVDGVAPPPDRGAHYVDFTSVGPGFFAAAGIPILDGRSFDDRDDPDGEPVAIINQAMADRFWPDQSAVGRVFRVEVPGWDHERRVVGVSRTTKVRTLSESPTPFIYLPFSQEYNSWVTILARTEGPPGAAERVAEDLLHRFREVHPEGILFGSTTVAEHIGVSLIARRVSAVLASLFAGVALMLAVIGLYGVVSFAVSRRTAEVGIRVSLGADSGAVLRLMVAGAMRLVMLGATVGLVLGALLARVTSGFLYGVEPLDPLTFICVTTVLFLVALPAAALPAARATRVDPLEALKAR
jgi:predicted permease